MSSTGSGSSRRLAILIPLGIGTLLMLVVHLLPRLQDAMVPGPTFIEEVRSGAVQLRDITRVEILKFDPGAGWPGTHEAYAAKARKRLTSRRKIGELFHILLEQTTDGFIHKDHPACCYYGILRFDLEDGSNFYVLYEVDFYRGQHYTTFRALTRCGTCPNRGRDYENVPLAEFLREHDPWFVDVQDRGGLFRPSSPDNVP